MNSSIILRGHLGLGDHIICNGMVMELLKDYREVLLPVKRRNVGSVKFMFTDLNVTILPVENDEDADAYCELHGTWGNKVLKVGMYGEGFLYASNNFSSSFYEQAGIDFETSWSSFYLKRDRREEERLLLEMNPPTKYIFVHDDESRNLTIDTKLMGSDLPLIRPDKTLSKNIFEYCSIMENAEEIHCIDSSFALLADRIDLDNDKKITIHRYARALPKDGNQQRLPTFYKKNWKIIL